MPRPGPRPYECIRRAWHSESHQPLRGHLIQEIFRLVNDFHDPSIRGKKEWQDKLPIVVLRAEEILYSKADSESEYLDFKSLWSRLDDAVNTMIRREEEDEGDGPFLQPCVEAALSLGCCPKRGTRGNRQGSRLFVNDSRTKLTAVSPIFTVSGVPKYTAVPNMPYSSNNVAMQNIGSNCMYCEATWSAFNRHNGCPCLIYRGSMSPMFNGSDYGHSYILDGSPDVEGLSYRQLVSNAILSTTYSPECMRMLELGQLGALTSAWNTATYGQSLPPASQGNRIMQSFPTAGAVTTASCSSAFTHTTAHSDFTRSYPLESQTSPPVDSNLPLYVPHLYLKDVRCNRTSMPGTEGTGSLLHELASFCCEEPACSSRTFSLKDDLIMTEITEVDNVALVTEHHDLQLRLALPGEINELTSSEEIMKALNPAVAPQLQDLDGMM